MRKISALVLLLTIQTSAVAPVFAQKANIGRQKTEFQPVDKGKGRIGKINPKAEETRFAMAEALSTGDGVWVHWRMEVEANNVGFFVRRVDSRGEATISDVVAGAAIKSSEPKVYGGSYTFFDPNGEKESVYFVDAVDRDGKRTGSSGAGVEFVDKLPKVPGSSLFQPAPELSSTAYPTKAEPVITQELRAEVRAGLLEPNPDKHREVISMPGARIAAKGSGLIRVTRAQLQSAGFQVNSDPNLWQLYLEGNERPIIVGPNADYIEFFGKELDTVESDIRTFYLVVGNTAGRRINQKTFRPGSRSVLSNNYPQTFTLKERTEYVLQILNGEAENYWGRIVSSANTTLNFSLSGVDMTPGDRAMTVAFQGFTLGAHNVILTLNGNALPNAVGSFRDPFSATFTIPASYLVEGNNQLTMRTSAGNDFVLFDSISIDFPRAYKAINNRLDFFTPNYRRAVLSGFSTPNVRLFDVTYEGEPYEMVGTQIVNTNGTYGPVIPSGRGRVFHAMEAGAFRTPISVLPNNPEMLGVPSQAATLLIITHRSLMPEAQAWAAYRSGQGITTKVIDIDDVMDEFNYGVSNSYAIEDFLEYAKYNWQSPPSYVLILGDASFDPRNYTNQGYWNMVPTRMVNTLFEETGSDEALADFNNDGLAELSVGRISSRNGAGVTAVLNKVITWESGLNANSMDRGALFTYDLPDGYNFQGMSDRIMAKLPAAMPKTTVQRGVPDNASAQAAVINSFNTGPFVANYSGHGTAAHWRDGNFFGRDNVASLTNASQPTLVTALTCLNGFFIYNTPDESFAEAITKKPNGGAVAIWASTGKTTPDVQEIMALRFYEQLALGNIPRLGDLIADAKAQLIGGGDVRLSWALIGDPMLKVR